MQQYDYAGKAVNGALLSEQLAALAIAGYSSWSITADGQIGVYFAGAISDADRARLDAVIAGHDSAQPSSAGILSDGRTAAQQAADAQDATDRAAVPNIRDQIVAAVNSLQAIVNAPDPTQANLASLVAVAHAVKAVAQVQLLQIQVEKYIVKRAVDEGRL